MRGSDLSRVAQAFPKDEGQTGTEFHQHERAASGCPEAWNAKAWAWDLGIHSGRGTATQSETLFSPWVFEGVPL